MPPPFVKTTRDAIYYYYAKLVMAPSAGLKDNYGFIVDRYRAPKGGQVLMSDYDRELFHKEAKPEEACAYCEKKAPLTQDHVVCCDIGAPQAMHNVVWACKSCNSSKGSKDLIAWWDEVYGRGIKGRDARDCLPRLPAGIYLKLAYDWHKVNHSLDYPARDLRDLRPFQPVRRSVR
jgi:hypothetical protein